LYSCKLHWKIWSRDFKKLGGNSHLHEAWLAVLTSAIVVSQGRTESQTLAIEAQAIDCSF